MTNGDVYRIAFPPVRPVPPLTSSSAECATWWMAAWLVDLGKRGCFFHQANFQVDAFRQRRGSGLLGIIVQVLRLQMQMQT